MKEAKIKLDEAKAKGAVKDQEKALTDLNKAKAALEEILRQMREEEIERILAMLEARFLKMLRMQKEVYEGTVLLDKVPKDQRTHNNEIESSRLSNKEMDIVVEVDKALKLLKEEGTAVVFPEAVEEMRGDMEQVVQRLAQAKVEEITQSIEKDIIAALQDALDALKNAQSDNKKKPKPAPPSPPGPPQSQPLIDILAEIKMIRALQMRVNTRTKRYSKLVEGDASAEKADLLEALLRLGQQQERIYRVTRDIEMGKNKQ